MGKGISMISVFAAGIIGASAMLCAAADAKNGDGLDVLPSEAHLRYQAREIMALVHWGLNPYTGQEWGFGNVPVAKMTAAKLDPAQWVRAMKAAEIKSVVLVAKHHDGFCLWPSKHNQEYSMAAVPAPNTGRDLVREMSEACRKEGLKFGVYLSPWDRHQASYATPAYVDYFFAQWNDLLDNYGEISEIWLDGANGGTGWYGGANGDKGERRTIPKDYYRLPRLLQILHEKHPLAVAFGGGGDWSSAWCGNERGVSPETWWCPRMGAGGKKRWLPPEADFPLRGGWFFHGNEKPKSLARLVKIYFESVGRGAVMNIGIAPDTDGQVSADDVKRLAEFGEWVREFNATDLARDAKVTEKRDGNRLTVELALPVATEFNCVDIREEIAKGQRVSSFAVEVSGADGWRNIAHGTTVGHRRLARFSTVKSDGVRVTLEGVAPPQLLPPIAVRCAKEVQGNDVPAIDTYDKVGWKIVAESCLATRNARSAIDGNYSSLWHTHPLKPGPQPPPQSFTTDCGKELLMHGFDYVPRLDGCKHGMVDGYEFHVSPDGQNWTLAASGEFGNLDANPIKQRVTFANPQKARFFRFTATHSLGKNDHAALAEIDVW
ncbi:MAG: alpha-L-fucosidase [Kiritimatiellae bacterium]|nr:alpha-L-fucosidase [Kiritimatiellia bacterium]